MIQHTTPQPQAIVPAQLLPSPSQSLLDARILHAELGVRRDFSNWIKDQVRKYGFVEGVHFLFVAENGDKYGRGRPTIERALTHKAAAEIAAGHNSPQGRRMLRRLLDDLERAKASTPAPVVVEQTSPAALQRVEDRLSGIEGSLQAVADTVRSLEAFGPVDEIAGTYSIDDAAKMLRIAPDSLWLWLRQEKFLTKTTPAQKWIASGHMTLKPSPWTHKETGERHIYLQPRVTAKGVAMLRKRLEGQQ